MTKLIDITDAIEKIKPGMSVMIGGFIGVGTPYKLVDALAAAGLCDLTLIRNDTGLPNMGTGKLITNKQVSQAYVSHVGTNPETGRQMNNEELTVHLVPLGYFSQKNTDALEQD